LVYRKGASATNLVTVQSTHSPFNLGGMYALDIVAFLVLDKDTGEESNHVGSMEKHIGFLERHALV